MIKKKDFEIGSPSSNSLKQVMEQYQQSFYSIHNQSSNFENDSSSTATIKQKLPPIFQASIQSSIKLNINVMRSSFKIDEKEQESEMLKPVQSVFQVSANLLSNNLNNGSHSRKLNIAMLEETDLSAIEPKEFMEDLEECSMCLLKEIDCLNGEEVRPAELKDIKSKIELLKREQIVLQGSLRLAMDMLEKTKSRNLILEKQILLCRNNKSSDAVTEKPMLKTIRERVNEPESRFFPQQVNSNNNNGSNKSMSMSASEKSSPQGHARTMKNIYRMCSVNSSFCIYQNQGYKIQVQYTTTFKSSMRVLRVAVRLTPHHHIAAKQQFKFGISLHNNEQSEIEMCYSAVESFQEFARWPERRFLLQATVVELDESTGRKHRHFVMVPLPITHFFERRLMANDRREQLVQRMKSCMSRYELSFNGQQEQGWTWAEKLQEQWWGAGNCLLSCLGVEQMLSFSIIHQNGREMKVVVEGKRNGHALSDLIEFLSFYLGE